MLGSKRAATSKAPLRSPVLVISLASYNGSKKSASDAHHNCVAVMQYSDACSTTSASQCYVALGYIDDRISDKYTNANQRTIALSFSK